MKRKIYLTGLHPIGTYPGPSKAALKNSRKIMKTHEQNIAKWSRPKELFGGYHERFAINVQLNRNMIILSAMIGPQCRSLRI